MKRRCVPALAFLALILMCLGAVLKAPEKSMAATQPMIFIGDSRTEGMSYVLSDKQKKNVVFYAETSQGYDWFNDEVIAKVTTKLYTYPHVDFKIIISLGINDHTGNISNYVKKYNELAKNEWSGFDIYIVSIAPVDEAKMRANCLYPQTNQSIKASNTYLKNHLKADNLHYINLYGRMINPYGTGVNTEFGTVADGAHYTSDSYYKIWKYIKKQVSK